MFDREFTAARGATTESALLLGRVSFLTLGCVLCTAVGAAITWQVLNPILFFGAMIATFVMIFVLRAVANNFPVNLVALAVFAGLEGMVMGPALRIYAHVHGPTIIIQAALMTALIFGIVGTLGYTSSRSYAHWLPWLFGGLMLLLIGGLVLMFLWSPVGNWLYSVIGCALFVAFTFVDFTRIKHDYSADQYIPATLQIYLDLINLFWFILRILGGRRSD